MSGTVLSRLDLKTPCDWVGPKVAVKGLTGRRPGTLSITSGV